MSSTYLEAGDRSADLRAVAGGKRAGTVPRAAVNAREKRRPGRARLGPALTLALALLSLAGAGLAVGAATLASGTARPQDWAGIDWSLVGGRYQACREQAQGPGIVGCLAAIGPRAGGSTASQRRGLVYITTTVQEPATHGASAVRPGAPAAAASHAPPAGAPARAGSPATTAPATTA